MSADPYRFAEAEEECADCGDPTSGQDHYFGDPLCAPCARDAFAADEADRRIADRKENPDDY